MPTCLRRPICLRRSPPAFLRRLRREPPSQRSGSRASCPRWRSVRPCWKSSWRRSARTVILPRHRRGRCGGRSATSTPFAANGPAGSHDIWRVSTTPSRGAEIGQALGAIGDAELIYDWAGGLIWAALPAADDAHAPRVRSIVAARGGHATLIRAPVAVRAAVAVFAPEPAPLAALSGRVRKGFDPQGVLNAGRMWAGV